MNDEQRMRDPLQTSSPEKKRLASPIPNPVEYLSLQFLKRQNEPEPMGKEEAEYKKDPTLPVRQYLKTIWPVDWLVSSCQATNHGNEPSKGAKIDAELKAEEEETLKKKGAWGSKKQ